MVESGPEPLQEGGFSHSAHECNIKCNKKLLQDDMKETRC
jgi:hypothetical protein